MLSNLALSANCFTRITNVEAAKSIAVNGFSGIDDMITFDIIINNASDLMGASIGCKYCDRYFFQ